MILELVEFIYPKQVILPDFRHIAFEVENADKYYRKLFELGVNIISMPVEIKNFDPRIDGKKFFYFRDPDGNLIEISEKGTNKYSA